MFSTSYNLLVCR